MSRGRWHGVVFQWYDYGCMLGGVKRRRGRRYGMRRLFKSTRLKRRETNRTKGHMIRKLLKK